MYISLRFDFVLSYWGDSLFLPNCGLRVVHCSFIRPDMMEYEALE